MKNSVIMRTLCRFAIVGIALFAPLALSSANTTSTSITIVNQSGKEIRHFYLSPTDSDQWGNDELSEPIGNGSSRTLNVSWSQSTVKLVAEDEDGCFMYQTTANETLTWTLSSTTSRDCGF
jgi:hypothetical protein